MSNLLFFAPFKLKTTTLGVDVTATINVWKIARATGTKTVVTTGGATTYVGDGVRQYLLTGADLATYDYVATMQTADTTVTDRQPACLWTRWDEAGSATLGGIAVDYQQRGVAVTLPSGVATTANQAAILDAIAASGIDPDDLAELLRAAGLIQIPVNPTAPSSIEGGRISIRRGDTFSQPLSLAASAAGYDKLWLTLKNSDTDGDEKAILQFVADVGLERVNGAAASNAALGAITLDVDGVTLTVDIDESITALLGKSGVWDVQMLKDDNVTTISSGKWSVLSDVTRATE